MPAPISDEPLPPLSDQDIELLYSIVNGAQEFVPQFPPLRALFLVYDQQVAEHGRAFDPDNIYSHFLLRLRERNGDDDSLFGRFKTQLDRLGIQVDLDFEGRTVDEITRRFDEFDFDAAAAALQNGDRGRAPVSRRASFSSLYDAMQEAARNEGSGRLDQHGGEAARPSSRNSEPSGRRHRRGASMSSWQSRGRMNGRVVSDGTFQRRKRNRSVSSRGSIRITRPINAGTDTQTLDHLPIRSKAASSSDDEYQISLPHSDTTSLEFHIPPEMAYQPSRHDVLADAETFRHLRAVGMSRRVLRAWRDKAATSREDVQRMETIADTLDRDALLRQPFGLWRAAADARKQDYKREEFFQNLEDRAGRARDLFLLTKAFTHWSQCALDESKRTSVARRHVMRSHYFNAWKDITMAQELKVRRVGVRKFFGPWLWRTKEIQAAHTTAWTHYEQALLAKVFRAWFWSFCERAAPSWAASQLKRKFLGRWRAIVQHSHELEALASRHWAAKTQRRSIQFWTQRERQVLALDAQADEFRNKSVLKTQLQCLSRRATLDPPARLFLETVDLRIVWTAFLYWQYVADNVRQAREFDHRRLLRLGFAKWNSGLRCRVITKLRDARIQAEAFYRLLLAARCAGRVREKNVDTAKQVLSHWRSRKEQHHAVLESQAQVVEASRRQRSLRTLFKSWSAKAKQISTLSQEATAVSNIRLGSIILDAWQEQHSRLEHLNALADNAYFFVSTTNALRQWREATTLSRQRRRREAYALIRRKTKVNLARHALQLWRDRAAFALRLNQQGDAAARNRLETQCLSAFDRWRQRTAQVSLQNTAASLQRRKVLAANAMRTWHIQTGARKHADDVAIEARARTLAVTAKTCLRRMNWRAWQLTRSAETAQKTRELIGGRHRLNMLRHWAAEAQAARKRRLESDPTAEPHPARANLGISAEVEERADFAATRPTFELPDEDADDGELGSEASAHENDTRTTSYSENWRNIEDYSVFDVGRTLNLNLVDPGYQLSSAPAQQALPPHTQATPQPLIRPGNRTLSIRRRAPLPDTDASAATTTPLAAPPAYLRTPSKRSTANSIPRDRLLTLTSSMAAVTTTPRSASPLPQTPAFQIPATTRIPATAPARQLPSGALRTSRLRLPGGASTSSSSAAVSRPSRLSASTSAAAAPLVANSTPFNVHSLAEGQGASDADAAGAAPVTSFLGKLRKGGVLSSGGPPNARARGIATTSSTGVEAAGGAGVGQTPRRVAFRDEDSNIGDDVAEVDGLEGDVDEEMGLTTPRVLL